MKTAEFLVKIGFVLGSYWVCIGFVLGLIGFVLGLIGFELGLFFSSPGHRLFSQVFVK